MFIFFCKRSISDIKVINMKRKKILLLLIILSAILSACGDSGNSVVTPPNSSSTDPRITVKRLGFVINPGNEYPFGNVAISEHYSIAFSIENSGGGTLNVTEININGAEFSHDADLPSAILPDSDVSSVPLNFNITFTPALPIGQKTARVSIISNDTTNNQFTFDVYGFATTIVSEINIKDNESLNNILSGSGNKSFGSTEVGTPVSKTFTIENLGKAALNLTGIPLVDISSAQFTVTAPPATPISTLEAPPNFTTFTIRFNPTVVGYHTATVTIESNDPDEGTYTFTILGNATAVPQPEINVKQEAQNLPTGPSTFNYGEVPTTSFSTKTFTIQNVGSANLTLSGPGPNYVDFVIGSNPDFAITQPATTNITPGGFADFTITFTPSSTGYKSATITINNSDSNEDPYTFHIEGTGAGSIATIIPDSVAFGNVSVNSTSTAIPITVQNTGDAPLIVNSISVPASPFSLNTSSFTLPGESIAIGASKTFTVTFSPIAAVTSDVFITIVTSEGCPTVNVSGTGVGIPEIDISQAASIPVGGSISYGSVTANTNSDLVYTITNSGTGNLALTGTPTVSIGGSSDFTVNGALPTSPVLNGTPQTFTIRFTPSSIGFKSATVTVDNDDSNENPYVFTVTGTGSASLCEVTPANWDFGSVNRGSTSSAVTFTIKNTGNANLVLTNSPYVTTTGNFAVASQPSTTTLTAGSSTTFTATFTPGSSGALTGTLVVHHQAVFGGATSTTVNVSGTGVGIPEIGLEYGGVPTQITVGGNYNYWASNSVNFGSYNDQTITIRNSGTANLILSGTPLVLISGTDAAMFSVQADPSTPVLPSTTTSFTLRFSPTSPGTKTATITIYNNDNDEGSYLFTVSALANGITTIDTNNNVGQYASLTLGPDNNIYTSYYDATSSYLRFAKSTDGGTTWSKRLVDSSAAVGQFSSIAADGTSVYIAYYDASTTRLKIAKSSDCGSTWGTPKEIENTADVGQYTAIAAIGDTVYVAYYDATNLKLKFAKSTDAGITWPGASIVTVDDGGGVTNVGQYTSMAVDGSDVYISYYDVTNTNLKVAKSIDGGATWPGGNLVTADNGTNVGQYTSIAVDYDGANTNIYVSYYDVNGTSLYFATADETNWTTSPWGTRMQVDNTATSTGQYSSLGVDVNGYLYISYYDSTPANLNLKIAKSTNGGGVWSLSTVDTNADVGQYSSILMLDENVIGIGYYDATTGDLKFAKSTDGGTTW